ncbi:MAG: hypothetical protein ACK44B_03255 [Flavobacteriales bacterium]|jgi:hypothetical protein
MKWILLLSLFCTWNKSYSQTTSIPDANFEQILIAMGIDSGSPDGSVPTSAIDTVDYLYLTGYNISDMTGIQDFIALETLTCEANPINSIDLTNNFNLRQLFISHCDLTSLDLSSNYLLDHVNCSYNELQSLDLSNNQILETFSCRNNPISTIDFSNNPIIWWIDCSFNSLMNLDISQNNNLLILDVESNQLTQLDVSHCDTLISLYCNDNLLQCLNLKNGNNDNPMNLKAANNPFLECIEVDNPTWATANWTVATGNVDPTVTFSNYCNNTCSTGIEELNLKQKELIQVYNLLGQEIGFEYKGLIIRLYSDGTVDKTFKTE